MWYDVVKDRANQKVGMKPEDADASNGTSLSRRFLPLNREIFALQTPKQFIELFTR